MDARRRLTHTPDPSPRSPARAPVAPGTRIGYDPMLLTRFRGDHRRMLGIFTQVQDLLLTHDYDGVRRKLGEFRILLQDHLMLASAKLYVYVARLHANDNATSARIRAHRQDMLHNNRLIMDFLRTYSAARLDDSFAAEFQSELLAIGAALVERIDQEESTLYPLYRSRA